jgi:hypothetical protein
MSYLNGQIIRKWRKHLTLFAGYVDHFFAAWAKFLNEPLRDHSREGISHLPAVDAESFKSEYSACS